MRKLTKGLIALAIGLAPTVQLVAGAPQQSTETAEKLRKLDIMLMVSSLRCRTTDNDFRPEYGRFTAKHLALLNTASRTLKAQWTSQLGEKGAVRRLDRLSVTMANSYGLGHPWLDCAGLKLKAKELADSGDGALLPAAEELLQDRAPSRVYLAAADTEVKTPQP